MEFSLFSLYSFRKKSIDPKRTKKLIKAIHKKDYQIYQKDIYLSNLRLIATITYSQEKIMPKITVLLQNCKEISANIQKLLKTLQTLILMLYFFTS